MDYRYLYDLGVGCIIIGLSKNVMDQIITKCSYILIFEKILILKFLTF
jgi:hypothetical protein